MGKRGRRISLKFWCARVFDHVQDECSRSALGSDGKDGRVNLRSRWCSVFFLQEIEVGGGRKAIIIFVPVPQLKSFQKIQVRLVRELEKKFSGKHVVFIAQVCVVLGNVLFWEFCENHLCFTLCLR